MYWQKDTRFPCQGYHYCAVQARERSRQRYHSDKTYRHTKNASRVFVGGVYVGRESQFPKGRESVEPLREALNDLKARQRAERAGLGGK